MILPGEYAWRAHENEKKELANLSNTDSSKAMNNKSMLPMAILGASRTRLARSVFTVKLTCKSWSNENRNRTTLVETGKGSTGLE